MSDEAVTIRIGLVSAQPRFTTWLMAAVEDSPRLRLMRVVMTIDRIDPKDIDILVLAGEGMPLQELILYLERNSLRGAILFSVEGAIDPKILMSSSRPLGWLSPEMTRAQFSAAIEAVYAGFNVISAGEESTGGDVEIESLSDRETQVLRFIVEGFSNQMIAEALQISENTVKFHLTNIYSKLGVSRRSAAIRKAIGNGLIAL
ncbi:response regulator containing a CheY-like receiver domain and an HTH DNA-binding domain [Longilinea arvoryzae]|uniref:Response regulator containing a CheY-like receiver domain and an HTH DNA-binding domain n=1 Tax=Longilinea arvoryzae TaxID=360412 RepID=A0A0S7BHT3_9CHLR|nr:response regulator transcription factor [Longilinea arvoryzae]GAP14660.1 response regulator containing a CheY-like receiver domain and an HTH DNA-binding domain [Longilinea arvoryzae]